MVDWVLSILTFRNEIILKNGSAPRAIVLDSSSGMLQQTSLGGASNFTSSLMLPSILSFEENATTASATGTDTSHRIFQQSTDTPVSMVMTTLTSAILSGGFFNGTTSTTDAGDITIRGSSDLSSCDSLNAAFNCTLEQYLVYARGPQTLPLTTALLVTIFFLGILITGVIGNVIVCIVIVRHPSMHTATNYYLFSLAVSDLVFLIMGLPLEISLCWHQYPYNLGLTFCKLRALISEASTYVSVLTIVAFSMERFLAICHPLHLYTMSGLKRAFRIIAALWIISFLSAVPFGVFTSIDYVRYPPDNSTILDSAFCAMLENPPGFPLWELSSCLFFVIPMILIVVLYVRMGCQIKSRTKHTVALGVRQGSMRKVSRHQQSRKAIIRMLAAVVIMFFVCWLPFHAQRLMYLYGRDWDHYQVTNTWLFLVSGWLYYVSCTINPILYNVMSHRYRTAFKETLWGDRKRSFRKSGYWREQSSFRETTITTSGNYDNNARWVNNV